MSTVDSRPSTGRTPAVTAPRRAGGLRVALLSVARVVVVYAVLLTVYVQAPWERIDDIPAGIWLTAWLLAVVAAVGWQLRSVLQSTHPWSRAGEAAALSVALLLIPFATAYALMSKDDPGSFTQPMTRVDALYFTVTVFATVGFGDLAPVAEPARIVVTVQMLVDLVLIGVIVKVLAGAAQQRRRALTDVREGRDAAVDGADPAERPPAPR